jgi:hypothetical protein
VADRRKPARLLLGGAGLLLVLGACANGDSPKARSAVGPTTSIASATATTPVLIATTSLPPGSVPVPTTIAPVDGATLLQQALSATVGGYHFNQTATVDGVVAVTVDGDRLPTGARLSVTNDAGLVNYVITPDGTWLMPENGDWEADDSPAPAVDPIAALSAPTGVSVLTNDGTTVQLAVTVPATALGLTADGDAPLQVTITGGALTTISYSTTTPDGKIAAATTSIGAVVDPSPVVPPI